MRFLAIVMQYPIFYDKNNIQLNISTSHCLSIKQTYMQAWLEFTETIKFQNLESWNQLVTVARVIRAQHHNSAFLTATYNI